MYDDDEEEVTGSMMAVFYITFAGIAIFVCIVATLYEYLYW